jgi:hypothetical protein
VRDYSKEFSEARSEVESLETRLQAARLKLQEVCPHVTLDGRSTFPKGISFVDCRLCGISTHDV